MKNVLNQSRSLVPASLTRKCVKHFSTLVFISPRTFSVSVGYSLKETRRKQHDENKKHTETMIPV